MEIYITLLQEEYLIGFDFGIGKKEKGILWFHFPVLFMASGASFVPSSFLDIHWSNQVISSTATSMVLQQNSHLPIIHLHVML